MEENNGADGGEIVIERDVLGRRRREYFDRIQPFERYREDKFQARYRLTKEIAGELADDFGQSDFATSGRPMGGGLSHRDRVRILINEELTNGE